MSYILDALKKSDQERQQNNGPNLQSVHRQQPVIKASSSKLWWLVVLLLLIIAVFSSWFYFTLSKPAPSVIAEQPVPVTQAPSLSQQSQTNTPTKTLAPTEVANNEALMNEALILVEFWELPDPVQQQIPPMTFSFHVYSENPVRRTIIINKQRVREGSTVSAGLVLEEITPQGVILNWQQTHRFSINVVENW